MEVRLGDITTRWNACLLTDCREREIEKHTSTSPYSIYWTGLFPSVKSSIEACALGGGGGAVYALLKQVI